MVLNRRDELEETDGIDDAPLHEIEIFGNLLLRDVVFFYRTGEMGNDEAISRSSPYVYERIST